MGTTTVTVVLQGGNYGFNNGSFGSISPIITAPNGSGIAQLLSDSGVVDFTLTLTGYAGSQTGAFTQIVVQTTAGSNRTYTAASATSYSSGSWGWGTGSSPVWTAAGTRTLTIS